jgi:hypothetical protein
MKTDVHSICTSQLDTKRECAHPGSSSRGFAGPRRPKHRVHFRRRKVACGHTGGRMSNGAKAVAMLQTLNNRALDVQPLSLSLSLSLSSSHSFTCLSSTALQACSPLTPCSTVPFPGSFRLSMSKSSRMRGSTIPNPAYLACNSACTSAAASARLLRAFKDCGRGKGGQEGGKGGRVQHGGRGARWRGG